MSPLAGVRRAVSEGLKRVWLAAPPSLRGTLLRARFGRPPAPLCRRLRAELRERLQAGSGPSFWFLPTATWYSSGFQRPQQMARALAEVGCPVVYYEPWSLDPHTTADGLRARDFLGVRDLAPRLHLLRCPLSLVWDFLAADLPDSLLMLWPEQGTLIPPRCRAAVVYEVIDDPSLVDNADPAWHRRHRAWLRAADVVTATADDLIAQLRPARPDALLLPNGVRLEDWETASPPVPDDLAAARRAPAVVGYYGALAEWFDWDLWEAAARLRPDWSFVLIGYPYDGDTDAVSARARRLPNTYYLGKKPYEQLPSYLAHFDVATIPFLLNAITHACSPVKLFEYLAGGKPVVTTPMREVLKYASVLTAEGAPAFAAALSRALARRDDPAYQAVMRRDAEDNTWRARAEALRQAVAAAQSS